MTETRQKQILVVEDEEKVATLLASRLESAGYDVRTEAFGEAALRYAASHRPDLVILDLKLPDIHGYQVCQELRKLYHFWAVPILMLSGLTEPIDSLRGFAYGADAYLTKPFEFSELLEIVAQLLGEPVQT